MAVNCTGCERRCEAQANRHCEDFEMSPQIDDCLRHTKYSKKASKPSVPNERPSYLWLETPHISDSQVQLSK